MEKDEANRKYKLEFEKKKFSEMDTMMATQREKRNKVIEHIQTMHN